ncbi:acyltransferase family protein [Actinotalea solisilvae]|uniref:acyltransferase family protein n=1 Tax=Actinotalea solisilvae TaxID=2072922 RepID=UPI0018F1DA6A|nr:acyltransferase family protein [Actinotalea solisilvae]
MSGLSARDIAAVTPAARDRYVDLLRAAAIVVVVAGHWTVSAVTVHDGELGWINLLQVAAWTAPLTWLFQVMPVVFLVGGYANGASWETHRRRGGTAAAWVRSRALRLLRPTAPFLLALVGGYAAAAVAGADPRITRAAVWLAAISLWFLVVYLAVVALGPLLLAAHARWGLATVAVPATLVAVGDVLRLTTGSAVPGAAAYLLAWVAVHQLGVAWRAGRLTRSPRTAWALVGGGLTALVLLTGPGPYGVTMVGAAPPPDLDNTAPPTLALLTLAATHTGLVLLVRRPADRWLARPRAWAAVVRVNAVALTLYLWHMVPVVLLGTTLVASGVLPQRPVGSGAWFLLRLPWLGLLAAVLVALVAVVGRWEQPARPPERPRAPDGRDPGPARVDGRVVGAGVTACLGGLLGLGVGGTDGLLPAVAGVPVAELALVGVGLGLVRWGGPRRTWTARAG